MENMGKAMNCQHGLVLKGQTRERTMQFHGAKITSKQQAQKCNPEIFVMCFIVSQERPLRFSFPLLRLLQNVRCLSAQM